MCTKQTKEKEKEREDEAHPSRTYAMVLDDPVKALADLHHSVARGLVEDLQKSHGARNILGTLHTCRAHLSASVESASGVQKTSVAIGNLLRDQGAKGKGNTDQLREALKEVVDQEEETKGKLETVDNAYIVKRLELQNELHANLKNQQARHLKISGGLGKNLS